jgi:hypothetical protein
MKEYPKIDTIWKRDMTNRGRIIPGDFTREEFRSINRWAVSEKIDGTNVRVFYESPTENDDYLAFHGRTDAAELPKPLLAVLAKLFTVEKFGREFPAAHRVTLYGEGYGGKIQASKDAYGRQEGFILFDVQIDGWWLEPDKLPEIATKFGVETVPQLGVMTTEEAVALVEARTLSKVSPLQVFEGVVARAHPQMMFRNPDHEPIMWKLKVKDYKDIKPVEKKDFGAASAWAIKHSPRQDMPPDSALEG